MPAIFLVGHGSRDSRANQECASLADLVAVRSGRRVGLGYIELAQPAMDVGLDAIAAQDRAITVFPVMLLAAGHVKQDVPEAIAAARERHPGVAFRVADPLGVHPLAVGVARQRAAQAERSFAAPAAETVVLFVGRGSSDGEANSELWKIARLFAERRDYALVLPAFMGATTPLASQVLGMLDKLAPRQLLVVPYLLFAGVLVRQLRAQAEEFGRTHPGTQVAIAEHLGPDPALADLIALRVAAAEGGA